jgi:small-conductance mechanosensitive channel
VTIASPEGGWPGPVAPTAFDLDRKREPDRVGSWPSTARGWERFVDLLTDALNYVDGHVRAINMRATEIVTGDNISIIVPNSEFISGRVVNWSHGDPKLRLRLPVGVSYRSDVDHVRKVLLDVAALCSDVLEDPAPDVDFVRFGQSALDLELHAWIADPSRRAEITTALHFAIRSPFLDEGIEIPFPQYELHFRPENDANANTSDQRQHVDASERDRASAGASAQR